MTNRAAVAGPSGAHAVDATVQPSVSGEGLRVLQVASSPRSFWLQQVAALEEFGIDCETVVVPGKTGRDRGPREYVAYYLRQLGRSLESFDLVHAHYGLQGPFALAQPVRPLVLTLWGSDLMGPEWLARVSRLSARFSDHVIVPSQAMSERLEVPHEVIPFGVDTDQFRPIPKAAARERLGWEPDSRVVLFPYATDRTVKNYPLAARVVDRIENAELRTVSGVPHDEMPVYMNASDAVLITSDRESGPMVIREAAACNVPVVSRDVGFAREVLEGVDHSAIADDEPKLATKLAGILDAGGRANGRAVLDELHPRVTAARLVETYRALA